MDAYKKIRLTRLMLGILLMTLLFGQSIAQPAAGERITNRATATFFDTGSGYNFVLESNFVTTIVLPLEALVLEAGQTIYRPAGAQVSFAHRLINTGNVRTAYQLYVENNASGESDDFDIERLRIFHDINDNGIGDTGDPIIEPGDSIWIQPGDFINLVVNGAVPAFAQARDFSYLTLHARAYISGISALNVDRVIITGGALIQLTKAANNLTPNPGDLVTFTLIATNTGNGPADPLDILVDGNPLRKVLLRDGMPANTQFSSISGNDIGTPLYHLRGSSRHDYQTTAPADPSMIDAVALAVDQLAVGESFTLMFDVNINNNARGSIQNTAEAYFEDGTSPEIFITTSNEVELTLPDIDPTINYYEDGWGDTTNVSTLGDPLFIEANASQCNVDPVVVDSVDIRITSGITGDRETFIGIETGINTGFFRILPSVPTRDFAAFPVDPENGILETTENDILTAELFGCGTTTGQITSQITVDPFGVVYNSKTNEVIEGARVMLIDLTGAGNGGNPGEPAAVYSGNGNQPMPATVTTGPDGRFEFPFVFGSTYQIVVTPPAGYAFPSILPRDLQPGNRTLEGGGGSYGQSFTINASAGPIQFDIPLDRNIAEGLFVEKSASRAVANIADFIDYTIKIRNVSDEFLGDIHLIDLLPTGFVYMPGSAVMDQQPLADPLGGRGPRLDFTIGSLPPEGERELRYRVRIGPGAIESDGINRAQAFSAPPLQRVSNIASSEVKIERGIFSDRGFIVGKVFLDCNQNGIQDANETGIPGIRLMLQDGTFVVTDGNGKYSIYGLKPMTHVLKLDPTSLPEGSTLAILNNRHAGDPATRFVDLTLGELQKADFAICNCHPDIYEAINQRRNSLDGDYSELTANLKTQMNPDGTRSVVNDVRRRSASGIVGKNSAGNGGTASATLADGPEGQRPINAVINAPAIDVAALLPTMNNEPGFLGLTDNDTLAIAQTNILVKGVLGANMLLTVNDTEVAATRIGQKWSLADQKIEVLEYVGVNLSPGRNTLKLFASDQFGNNRGEKQITLIAPDRLGDIRVELSEDEPTADGSSLVQATIALLDEESVPITARTPVSVFLSRGTLQLEDLNPDEAGVQSFIEGGKLSFNIIAPDAAGDAVLRVASDLLEAKATISYLPDLRPLVAAGIIEGSLNLRNITRSGILPAAARDGFEEELRTFTWTQDNGRIRAGGRAAMFLKGKIKGEMLLTMAYDSEKETRERLFRDIQPDEFYPVYGESSLRGFDAQSTSRLYVRVDRKKSYLLYGDFITSEKVEGRRLSLYNRSMTGLKSHIDNGRLNINSFASHDNNRQIVDEITAEGISGPYRISNLTIVENSEKIEIITRDRNQPAEILSIIPQTRFRDYVMQTLDGTILFRAPIPSVDENLNPIFIRITYEVQQGGKSFFVGGVDAQAQLTDNITAGALMVEDQNPTDSLRLMAANVALKLGEQTTVFGEYARTDRNSGGTGDGARVEVRHKSRLLNARFYAGRADEKFANPSSSFRQGRQEAGGKGALRLGGKTRIKAEVLHSKDNSSGGERNGGQLYLERSFGTNSRAELGVRHSKESSTPASSNAGPTPRENTTARARLQLQMPGIKTVSVFGEYEQDISDNSKKEAALGGTYQFASRQKLYARHEFMSSLSGVYTLNSIQERHSTVIGLDADYWKNGNVFSEYRISNNLAGRDAQAAIGLRNRWNLTTGLKAHTSFERVMDFDGNNESESISATAALEYTGSVNWKGTARFEIRDTRTNRRYLNTLGFARKLSANWTFLGRNVLGITHAKSAANGDQLQNWLRLGFAFRQTDGNRWNGLARYENKRNDQKRPLDADEFRNLHIFSSHWNYQPGKDYMVTGRVAAKFVSEDYAGMKTTYNAELFGIRNTYDISEKFDVSLVGNVLLGNGFDSHHLSTGAEIGYRLATNLWLSGGYNFFGFEDQDLAGNDYTHSGAFVRLRFKFDEDLIHRATGNKAALRRSEAYKHCDPYIPAVIDTPMVTRIAISDTIAVPKVTIIAPTIELPDRVHFALDKFDLDSKSAKILDAITSYLTGNDSARVTLVGHTDSRASDSYNHSLGIQRAKTVKQYLVSSGIDAGRITIRSAGESKLLNAESSRLELAKNRRVMMIVDSDDNIRMIIQLDDIKIER